MHILILGKNSYIGKRLTEYLQQFPADYNVQSISQRDGHWKSIDFSTFDSIVDCVGIAHRKETKANAHEYYEINSDLAFQTAKKAKDAGVKQFIFLSSMSVYGMDEGVITKETLPSPKTHYGKSKWQAEQQITPLQDETFHIAIVRPPMVYGEGCKGNYQTLVKLAKILPLVPDYKNERSMISIENLCAYLKRLIDEKSCGVFLPQDPEYHCTSEMLQEIAHCSGKSIRRTRLLNPGVDLLKSHTRTGKKAFGLLIYK